MVVRRRLFWKIYLTLLASLLAVAVITAAGWLVVARSHRMHWGASHVRLAGLNARPDDSGGPDVSLYGPDGALVAAHGPPIARAATERGRFQLRVDLPDGRVLLARVHPQSGEPGLAIMIVLSSVAAGVGLAALPITARLTRRLEILRERMARWGDGDTAARVDASGNDEVAMVGRTFNAAAARIDALLASQKALLANASHELRSPLARLRMAVDLWSPEAGGVEAAPEAAPEAAAMEAAAPEAAATRRAEVVRSLAEIDGLVAEILLHSRLDHQGARRDGRERVDLLGLCAEEGAPFDAVVAGEPVETDGEPVLLRRLVRNLVENGAKHGAPPIRVLVGRAPGGARLTVSDAGPGIAPSERERVFEPFYRPAGSSEAAGGWGLGLSLVRQIAERHGGRVVCEAAPDGGSQFVVALPLAAPRAG